MTLTLVTGATGFIGCRLVELWHAKGHELRAAGMVRNSLEAKRAQALRANGIELLVGNLLDNDHVDQALVDVKTVIHLAAAQHEANVAESYFHSVNVEATRNLLTRSELRGVQKLFFASSIGVYGANDDAEIDEDAPIAPDNHYGRSKAAAEAMLAEYRGSVELFVGRIGETYGPWDMRLHKLYKGIGRHRFVLVGRGRNLHQPVYIDDLAAMIERLLETSEAARSPLILAGDTPVTTLEMCESIASSLGTTLPRLKVPMLPLLVAAIGMEMTLGKMGIQPPLHRRRLDFFRKSLSFSTARRDRLLNLPPQRSFAEGAQRTARWYVEQRWLENSDLHVKSW